MFVRDIRYKSKLSTCIAVIFNPLVKLEFYQQTRVKYPIAHIGMR